MRVEKNIRIAAEPDKIWSYLTDPQKIPLWFDSFKKCQFSGEQRSGVGTKYYVEEKVPGPLRKINFESTTWDDHKKMTWEMTSGKNVSSYEIKWRLQKDQSQPFTEFYFTEDVGMPFGPIGKILGFLGRNTADKMVGKMLTELKSLAEK